MSKTTNKFSPEVRERAVRLGLDNPGRHESRWQAIVSVAAKIGCAANTLNDWVKKAEIDGGKRAGVTTEMTERLKALERENRELRQANEILRKCRLLRCKCPSHRGREELTRAAEAPDVRRTASPLLRSALPWPALRAQAM